ncbi:macoilin-1 [Clonorchis sinensis]|uniref:Macoilin n=1 Tax=Clonorchis sinensis TaxID=79923 RepID=G7Y5D7_CLOSI|nr:macoilin-1 [Clonorchis sinensis]
MSAYGLIVHANNRIQPDNSQELRIKTVTNWTILPYAVPSRRQRSVETQNATFFALLEEALPKELRQYLKTDGSSPKSNRSLPSPPDVRPALPASSSILPSTNRSVSSKDKVGVSAPTGRKQASSALKLDPNLSPLSTCSPDVLRPPGTEGSHRPMVFAQPNESTHLGNLALPESISIALSETDNIDKSDDTIAASPATLWRTTDQIDLEFSFDDQASGHQLGDSEQHGQTMQAPKAPSSVSSTTSTSSSSSTCSSSSSSSLFVTGHPSRSVLGTLGGRLNEAKQSITGGIDLANSSSMAKSSASTTSPTNTASTVKSTGKSGSLQGPSSKNSTKDEYTLKYVLRDPCSFTVPTDIGFIRHVHNRLLPAVRIHVIDSMIAVFNIDASLPYNHDLSESLIVKKRIKTLPDEPHRGDYQQVSSQTRILPPGDLGRYQPLHIPPQQPLDHQRLEVELKQLRTELHTLRGLEVDLRAQVQQLTAAERTFRSESSLARQESETLQAKMMQLTQRLETDRANLRSTEERLLEERKQRVALEQRLSAQQQSRQNAHKSPKDASTDDTPSQTASKTSCANTTLAGSSSTVTTTFTQTTVSCTATDSCATRVKELEAELRTLKRDLSEREAQLATLKESRAAHGVNGSDSTTCGKKGSTTNRLQDDSAEREELLSHLAHLQEENQRMTDTLKDEDKMKQELLTAYHASLKEITELNASLTKKEFQIVELNMRLESLTPHLYEYVNMINVASKHLSSASHLPLETNSSEQGGYSVFSSDMLPRYTNSTASTTTKGQHNLRKSTPDDPSFSDGRSAHTPANGLSNSSTSGYFGSSLEYPTSTYGSSFVDSVGLRNLSRINSATVTTMEATLHSPMTNGGGRMYHTFSNRTFLSATDNATVNHVYSSTPSTQAPSYTLPPPGLIHNSVNPTLMHPSTLASDPHPFSSSHPTNRPLEVIVNAPGSMQSDLFHSPVCLDIGGQSSSPCASSSVNRLIESLSLFGSSSDSGSFVHPGRRMAADSFSANTTTDASMLYPHPDATSIVQMNATSRAPHSYRLRGTYDDVDLMDTNELNLMGLNVLDTSVLKSDGSATDGSTSLQPTADDRGTGKNLDADGFGHLQSGHSLSDRNSAM